MYTRRIALIAGLILIVTTLGAAQDEPFNTDGEGDVNRVIVASTANFPDAMISSAPATKLGIPVLLTDKDELSPEVADAFEKFDVQEAYIVGGPAVVSDSVEQEIDSQVNSTTRLWGMSQIGTSVEVSEYFWSEGSDKVTIVQYPQDEEKGYRLLTAIKNEMKDIEGDEAPILISQEDTLSSSVLSEVERLGASEAEVYSTSAVNVTQDLEDAGVEEVEIEEAEIDELTDRLQETEGNLSKLVVVAAPNFKDALSTPSMPDGKVHIVSDRSEVDTAVQKVRATSPEEILAVGEPELSGFIADTIENETGREVEHVSGRPEEMASRMMNRSRDDWRDKQRKRYKEWKEEVDRSSAMKRAANRTINRAEEEVNQNSSEETQQLLVDAQEEYDNENYFEARDLAVKAMSRTRSEDFRRMSRQEVQERIQQERGSMSEIAKEMSEMNQEKAQELREAESFEERMEIMNEFKQEQRSAMMEIRKEHMRNRSEFRQKMKQRFDSEMETESKGSELELKLKGTTLELEAKYTAPTGGYSSSKDFQVSGNEIDFTFTLESPEGGATQALTKHEAEVERELDEGDYNLNMKIVVDGETVNQLEKDIEAPGFRRSRSKHSSSSSSMETRREMESRIEERREEFRNRVENLTDDDSDNNETGNEEENETEDEENTVEYTSSGFSPSTITVEAGEEVTWVNKGENNMWVASNEHPQHTEYDGTSESEHCEDGESETFDQCSTGDEYEFKFEKTGSWDYHNHINSGDTGTVVVE